MKKQLIKNVFTLSAIFVFACSGQLSAQEISTSGEPYKNIQTTVNDSEPKQQAMVIDYVVQQGDTLSSLTKKHLGDAKLWRLNAEINPQIPNVNALKPGSSIRLITGYEDIEPEVVAAQARIEIIANEVGKSLQRGDWLDATTGDELMPNDGIKTEANSSALLIFDEATQVQAQVQINENTRLFLSKGKNTDNNITRNEIEIESGEAELKIDSIDTGENVQEQEFEIMIGEVRTSAKLSNEGKSSTKARVAQDSSSQIMVYDGNSDVESGGFTVEVETGMGTVAKSGEAPSPPEKLLLAVALNNSVPTQIYSDDTVELTWQSMPDASSYTLKVCKDQSCTQILQHIKDISQNSYALKQLPVAQYYWRINAVSQSGLDGFPSISRSLLVGQRPPPVQPEPEPQRVPWYFWMGIVANLLFFVYVAYWYTNK